MEILRNAVWRILNVVKSRNLLLLNVILWLFIFYFSVYEDEKAAFLSYVSAVFTSYALRGTENIGESRPYFLDIVSKILILAGISLASFSKFWNTAFYSICLGILIKKVIYDMKLQTINVDFDVNIEMSPEVAETVTSDELNRESVIQLQKDTNIPENKTEVLNNKYFQSISLDTITDLRLERTPENIIEKNERTTSNEFQNLQKWNNLNLCVPEVVSGHDEAFSVQNFHEETDKSGNMLNDRNCKKSSDSPVDESTLKCSEVSAVSDKRSTDVNEEKVFLANLSTLNSEVSKLIEYALREFDNIKLELKDVLDYIERELKEERIVDTSEQSVALNVETPKIEISQDNVQTFDVIDSIKRELKGNEVNTIDNSENFVTANESLIVEFPDDNIRQLDVANGVEFLNEPERTVEEKLYNKRTNSDALDRPRDFIQNDFESGCSYKNLFQQSQKRIKLSLLTSGDCIESISIPGYIAKTENVDSSLINQNSSNSYIDSHNEECVCELNNTNTSIDQENGSVISTNLKKRNSYKTSENIDSKTKDSSEKLISVKIADIQTERETFAYQTKCSSASDINPEFSVKDLKVHPDIENNFPLDRFSKILDFDPPSKTNELTRDSEETNVTKETVKKAPEDENKARISGLANNEDVVNRIDLSFIYDLGVNVACGTNRF